VSGYDGRPALVAGAVVVDELRMNERRGLIQPVLVHDPLVIPANQSLVRTRHSVTSVTRVLDGVE
jgi:hypothetical protein